MFITGLGTAAPIHRYEQAQCWAALQASERFALLTPRSRAILRKVLTGNNGIRTRHFAMERLGLAFELTPDALHARFLSNAPLLAAQAAHNALADARAAVEKEKNTLVDKVRAEQEALLERTRREIGAERDKAVLELRREAVELALGAAAKVIGQRLDSESDRRIVLDYLAKVETPH